MENLSLKDLIFCLSKLDKLFDVLRVIDPDKKKVIKYGVVEDKLQKSSCYDFWENGMQCDNCVAARAKTENDTFIKIEFNNERVFLIIASPVTLEDDVYIVEMIKDITETGIITNLIGKSIKETNNIIFELNQKAVTDDLTGTYNRRYINERLPADIYNASCNNKNLSILMLDIDLFKDVNDTYGHAIGDRVIKELCKTVKSKIRKNYDWVARYGGEEFLIVLIDADRDIAYRISEKIRIAMENKVIKYDNHTIQVTVSIGVHTIEPGTKDFIEVMQIVDKNLYKAKKEGRNRTVST